MHEQKFHRIFKTSLSQARNESDLHMLMQLCKWWSIHHVLQIVLFLWEFYLLMLFLKVLFISKVILFCPISPAGGKQELGCCFLCYPTTSLLTAESTDCSYNQECLWSPKTKAKQEMTEISWSPVQFPDAATKMQRAESPTLLTTWACSQCT